MKPLERFRDIRECEGDPHTMRVLMYHRIVDDERLSRAHWTCIHVQEFRRQLEFLDRRGFTPITGEDYRFFLQGRLNLPRKPVIITFDDGYLDTYQYAFPLLQEFGMKAVVFVVGDRAIQNNAWDMHSAIKRMPETPLMDDHHILEMHAAGFEIGAHTMTHVQLPMLSEDEAWQEIEQSKFMLESLLDGPVRSFAYPYGLVNEKTKRMVERAGFDIAYGVNSGPALFGEDAYETRRTTVFSNTGFFKFALKMMTPFQYCEWARWKFRQKVHPVNGKQLWEEPAQPPQSVETKMVK